MFLYTNDLAQDSFFWFEKNLIKNLNWAALPKASKAIYPVIRSHCNNTGDAWPAEQTISTLCGRTEKVVRSGIKGLEKFPGIRIETYMTQRGRRSKRFSCKTPDYEKGKLFPFHKDVFLGGNWSLLKPTAQALYPVMRCFGYNDFYEYWETTEEIEGKEFDLDESGRSWDNFKAREYDFCEAEPRVLCEYAHIASRSYKEAIMDLEKRFLIKAMEGGKFMVYLHPPKVYRSAYLNKQAMERRRGEKEA